MGTSTPRSGGTVAVDGVADFDPPPTDLAQPQKRPTSATKRFCFSRPNECPQSDWTGWSLADGAAAAIAGTLDDHSRYVPALRAADGQGTAELVWSTMLAGITECGIPARSLTDNGMVYTGRLHAFEAAFEANLRAQRTKHPDLPRPRIKTTIMSVSDVPRQKCQRCPETPHCAWRHFSCPNRRLR